jgi:hypothetical protein
MPNTKKTDEEINKILTKLRDIKSYDSEAYNIKLKELKKNDSSTYFKIMILLNLDTDAAYSSTGATKTLPTFTKTIMPKSKTPPPNLIKPKIMKNAPTVNNNQNTILKSNKPVTKRAPKKSNPFAFAILAMAIIGILLLSVVGFFWMSNPPTSDTSRNSLRLGYQIFNNLTNTYLNYTFLYNSSDLEFIGKQYYFVDNSKVTAIVQYPQRDIISKKQNSYLFYDVSGNYSKTATNSLRINNVLVISLYDEVYNLVNNYYTNESGREGVWNLTNIACAPIFFEIDVNNEEFSDLTELRYEMCLDNNGIPIAIAKESIFQDSYELIIAYLESQNNEIKDLVFSNKTMTYWQDLVIDDI